MIRVGIIGLGRMGMAIAKRLLQAGHEVFGYDISQEALHILEHSGGNPTTSVQLLAGAVDIIWLMLPAGSMIDANLKDITPVLHEGQIIIDGGNSNYLDSIRRAQQLERDHISYLDCGTSGGLHGATTGFCLMIGGDRKAFMMAEEIFKAVAAPQGYALVGPSGAGHYVKMIHNGIEYALLESYAEGFNLLKEGYFKNLDLAQIAGLWEHGSIIRSWILHLAYEILKHDQELDGVSGKVSESGMGRWTVEYAESHNIPVPLIKQALAIRTDSQKTGGNYATKLIAMLRNAFGGHTVEKI